MVVIVSVLVNDGIPPELIRTKGTYKINQPNYYKGSRRCSKACGSEQPKI
jgi:hypothetical protein